MSKGKYWCFTLNNPKEGDEEIILNIECDYLIFQLEEGENKTPHMQGYIKFRIDKRFELVKKYFKVVGQPHIVQANGSPSQNREYCTKDEGRLAGPWEKGSIQKACKAQGHRTDLEEVAESIKSGESLKYIAESHSTAFIKYYKGIEQLKNTIHPIKPRNTAPIVTVYYGPSGTGKSHRAEAEANTRGSVYFLDFRANGQVDWSSYEGQDSVIINDFYGGGIKWGDLLKVLDKYPNKVSALYKSIEFTSSHIYITSNVHPQQWYKNIPNGDWTPLERRIAVIEEMKNIVCPRLLARAIARDELSVNPVYEGMTFNETKEDLDYLELYNLAQDEPITGISRMERSDSNASTVILCDHYSPKTGQCGNAWNDCDLHSGF